MFKKFSYSIMMAVMVKEGERKGREGKGRATQKMLFALLFVDFYIEDFSNDSYLFLLLIP